MLQRSFWCLALCVSGCLSAACGTDSVIVLDLVGSIDEAALWLETAEIDVGREPARRHQLDGWLGFGERWLGRNDLTFEWSRGASSALRFFVFEPRDLTLRFAGRPYATRDLQAVTRMTIIVNGSPLGTLTIGGGWQEYAQTVPRQTLRFGENRVVFLYDGGETPSGIDRDRRFAWDSVNFDRTTVTAPPQRALGSAVPTLLVPYLSRIAYTVTVPDGAFLELARMAPFGPHAEFPVGTLVVTMQRPGEEATEVRVELERGRNGVSLPLGAGGEVALSLTAMPAPGERVRQHEEAIGLLLERPAVRAMAGGGR